MRLPVQGFILILLAGMTGALPAAEQRYDVAPPPAWVELMSALPAAGANAASGGAEYVLVDRQTRLDKTEAEYSRFVTRLLNASGVEDNSKITIDFDPAIEKLHLHAVLVRRGDTIIDELKQGRIRILQREGELEDDVLDGELTFHLLLSDLRIGDTVDYSYTVERREPAWGDRFFGEYPMSWQDPVRISRLRISAPTAAPLKLQSHAAGDVSSWSAGGFDYHEWRTDELAAVHREANAPRWYEWKGSVEFSQFADWGAVAAAARPLYSVKNPGSPPLRELAERLGRNLSNDADRAVAVMKFVQDEIHYTGIEEGEAAFRPTVPSEVLSRRYGDCKDKTLLAVTLLRELGIDAAPALVSTHWSHETVHRLPSPGVMNHAIVRARIAGRDYWFDATSTGQGGRLEHFTQSQLGWALPVAEGVNALQAIPNAVNGQPTHVTHSSYDVTAGTDKTALLSVETTYRDEEADRIRRELRSSGKPALEKQYLDYYKEQFASTRSKAPMEVLDDSELNQVTLREHYAIDRVFEVNGEGPAKFDIELDAIASLVKVPTLRQRSTPLRLTFPANVDEVFEVKLPEPWNIKTASKQVHSALFEYDSKTSYTEKILTLEYHYRALSDHVEPPQLAGYIKDVQSARRNAGYQLTLGRAGASNVVMKSPKPDYFVLGVIAAAAGFFILVQLLRHWLTMRILLLYGALRRSTPVNIAPAELPAGVHELLVAADAELLPLGFTVLGYASHDALSTQYGQPEHVRVYAHASAPVTALVSRRPAPEFRDFLNVALISPCQDGRLLYTVNSRPYPLVSQPLTEAMPTATVKELFTRHSQRLERLGLPLSDAPPSLEAGAALIERGHEEFRATLRQSGLTTPTSDGMFDRFTYQGGFRLARAAIKAAATPMRIPLASQCTPEEIKRRVDADVDAVRHFAHPPPAPAQARRAVASLDGLIAAAVIAVLIGTMETGVWLGLCAAVIAHELGHFGALRAVRTSAGPLIILRALGISGRDEDRPLSPAERAVILAAGPMLGLLLAIILLAADLLWPKPLFHPAAAVLVSLNALALLPLQRLDGSRLLDTVVARGESRTVHVALIMGGIVCLGAWLGDEAYLLLVIFWLILGALTYRSNKLLLQLERAAAGSPSEEVAARRALEAMTEGPFGRWRGSTRQVTAIAVAKRARAGVAVGREKAMIITLYALSIALAISAQLAVHQPASAVMVFNLPVH